MPRNDVTNAFLIHEMLSPKDFNSGEDVVRCVRNKLSYGACCMDNHGMMRRGSPRWQTESNSSLSALQKWR
jgi:hypothetical protein